MNEEFWENGEEKLTKHSKNKKCLKDTFKTNIQNGENKICFSSILKYRYLNVTFFDQNSLSMCVTQSHHMPSKRFFCFKSAFLQK